MNKIDTRGVTLGALLGGEGESFTLDQPATVWYGQGSTYAQVQLPAGTYRIGLPFEVWGDPVPNTGKFAYRDAGSAAPLPAPAPPAASPPPAAPSPGPNPAPAGPPPPVDPPPPLPQDATALQRIAHSYDERDNVGGVDYRSAEAAMAMAQAQGTIAALYADAVRATLNSVNIQAVLSQAMVEDLKTPVARTVIHVGDPALIAAQDKMAQAMGTTPPPSKRGCALAIWCAVLGEDTATSETIAKRVASARAATKAFFEDYPVE